MKTLTIKALLILSISNIFLLSCFNKKENTKVDERQTENLNDTITIESLEKNIVKKHDTTKAGFYDINIDSLKVLNLPYQIDESFLNQFTIKKKLDYEILNESDSIIYFNVGKFETLDNPDLIGVLNLSKYKSKSLSYMFTLTIFLNKEKKSSHKIAELSFLEEKDIFYKQTAIINNNFSKIKINSYNEVVNFDTDESEITNMKEIELEISSSGIIKESQ